MKTKKRSRKELKEVKSKIKSLKKLKNMLIGLNEVMAFHWRKVPYWVKKVISREQKENSQLIKEITRVIDVLYGSHSSEIEFVAAMANAIEWEKEGDNSIEDCLNMFREETKSNEKVRNLYLDLLAFSRGEIDSKMEPTGFRLLYNNKEKVYSKLVHKSQEYEIFAPVGLGSKRRFLVKEGKRNVIEEYSKVVYTYTC